MYKIYQIEYGDTLESIANKVGTDKANLMDINGFSSEEELIVGNLMIVPNTKNNIFMNYSVKNGDSIYSIARMYDVDPDTLLLINGLNKDDFIYPNQQIMIPSSNYIIYITREGDTLNKVINNFGVDANTLASDNNNLFLIEDQLIVSKKD